VVERQDSNLRQLYNSTMVVATYPAQYRTKSKIGQAPCLQQSACPLLDSEGTASQGHQRVSMRESGRSKVESRLDDLSPEIFQIEVATAADNPFPN
jgi:hypothetical protein